MKVPGCGRSLAVAFALWAAAGQLPVGSEEKSPCVIPAGCYAVVQSTLAYQDVSDSFAQSFYNDVRQIVRGYLADFYTEYCFYDSGLEAGAAGHDKNTLLDLQCRVERVSNKVILKVRIAGSDTQESLLSFETSASFFQPAAALASFAEAFPDLFAGRVVRRCSYTLPPEGFYLPRGELNLGLSLGNVRYTLEDLEKDLGATENAPPRLMRSARCLRIRRGIERAAIGLGALAVLLTAIPIAIIAKGSEDSSALSQAPPAVWITMGAGTSVCALTLLEMGLFPPRRLVRKLNDWRPSE